jgi:hypothetical protein
MLTTDNRSLSTELKRATANLTNSLCRQGETSVGIMNTTTTPPKITASTIAGTNITLVRNSQGSIDKYDRLVNIAKLHGNLTDDYNNKLRSQQNVLSCVNNLLVNMTYLLSSCDDSLTNDIEAHSLGDKQTIIQMAKEYLKARTDIEQVSYPSLSLLVASLILTPLIRSNVYDL